MLQNPSSDGPPSLGDLDASKQLTSGMQGPAITFSTSRATLSPSTDIISGVTACVRDALDKLDGGAQLLHVTYTPDLDPSSVSAASFPCAAIGRAVAKEGAAERSIEVLALGGGTSFTVGVGRSSDSPKHAITKAEEEIVSSGSDLSNGIFALFVSSDAVEPEVVRDALGRGLPAYGGSSQTLFVVAGGDKGNVVQTEEDTMYTCAVAYVQGSASFLVSAVIKSWTQPKYVHPLEFLKPKYVNDAEADLLEAIKFDDWDVFVECIEEKGVSVNHQWVTRQHQSPLLASAGRGRMRMVKYLLDNGADVGYRNDGGFNAVMYTIRLKDYGDDFVKKQLDILTEGGADLNDTDVIIPPPRS